jgi:hypothetical protein
VSVWSYLYKVIPSCTSYKYTLPTLVFPDHLFKVKWEWLGAWATSAKHKWLTGGLYGFVKWLAKNKWFRKWLAKNKWFRKCQETLVNARFFFCFLYFCGIRCWVFYRSKIYGSNFVTSQNDPSSRFSICHKWLRASQVSMSKLEDNVKGFKVFPHCQYVHNRSTEFG